MRDQLVETIREHHQGKRWWSGKSSVRICWDHVYMLDKAKGGAVPYSKCLTDDLERMLFELDRGMNVAPDSVGKRQELKRV